LGKIPTTKMYNYKCFQKTIFSQGIIDNRLLILTMCEINLNVTTQADYK